MKLTLIVIAIITGVFILSQIYFIMAKTETQPYKIIKSEKDLEIRKYPAPIMATISMDAKTYKELSSPGFNKLASYIFGSNEGEKKIAMTSPVHMDINDSMSSMSFVMPADYNLDNLPKPNDSTIKLEKSADEYMAAIQFGGFANDDEIKKYASKLEEALKRSGINYYGNFRFLGYNAPFQLLARRNEIVVNVQWNQ